MAYITQPDFADRFGQSELDQLLTGRAGAFTQCENDSAGEINGYLAGRYAIPLLFVPDRIKAVDADITRYRLYDDRSTDEVRTRYEDAIKWLLLVSRGDVILTDASGVPLLPPGTNGGVSPNIAVGKKTVVYDDSFVADYGLQQPRRALFV